MTALRIELRRSAALLAMPLLVFVGAYFVVSHLRPGVALWPDVNAQVNIALVLVAPLSAGVAAWCGSREHRRRTHYLRASSSRAVSAVAMTELAAVLMWCVTAFALVVGAAFVRTARAAHDGRPSIAWTVESLSGLAMFVVLGFIVGRVLHWRVVPPLVAVASYLVLAYGQVQFGKTWVTTLSPVLSVFGDVFWQFNSRLATGQTLWLLGLAATAVLAWCVALQMAARIGVPHMTTLLLVPAVGTAAAGITLVHAQNGMVYTRPATFSYTCAGTSPRVCVHPAFVDALEPLRGQLALLDARLVGTAASFRGVRQKLRAGDPPLGEPVVSVGLDDLRPGFAERAVSEMVVQRFIGACRTTASPAQAEAESLGVQTRVLQTTVISWLQSPAPAAAESVGRAARITSGLQPMAVARAASWFLQRSEASRRTWLRQHYAAFEQCSLTPSDFR